VTNFSQPPVNTLQLPDGRQLAWYEYGDPEGQPCIYTTGTPASGLLGVLYHESAKEAGVRFISLDKPGYGHSDYMPGRRLTDWPRDVNALADHLGLDTFAAMGESGGGPHVLALAWGLPERVTVALDVSGMGPGHEDWVRKGMKPLNRRLFWLAQKAPWLLRFAMRQMANSLKDPKRREKWIADQLKAAPPADRALTESAPGLTELTLDAYLDAIRMGPKGAAQEMAIFGQPWGFSLSEIRIPVQVWHGTEDVNVPVAIAERLCQEIPSAEALIFEGEGHVVGYTRAREIMQQIVQVGSRPAGQTTDNITTKPLVI